ncbi:MAG: protein arginine kinase [Candidatus Omnitrophota bacterium]|nr:MAG: protein arginine kinase [Candidatus Omnitrophota bacterium]
MFEEFLSNERWWLNPKGPEAEVVISSRLRLARNIKDLPFPSKATHSQKKEVLERVESFWSKVDILKPGFLVRMDEVNFLDRQFLLERHLISQEHINRPQGKGLIVSFDERISIMINEEDHLRIQVLTSGFNLEETWEIINKVDDAISRFLPYAFLPEIGYLTACPTNVGTALRASCMLHLPGLALTKRISKILELLAKLSFTTRGLFGEGTQALGNFFQISNQVSLGISEEEIIDNLSGVIKQIKDQEESARDFLLRKHKPSLEDSIWRALGILRNARLITTKEALSHLSLLCLGLDLGIIKGIKRDVINNLFIIIQPAHLQKMEGRTLEDQERDYKRAALLRSKLK